MPKVSLSLAEARRIALAAQGFGRARPARVRADHLRRTILQLGLLQIDSVNVLARPQYLVPFSRLGPYDTVTLDNLIYRRREFTEQWAHEASIVPVSTWPLLRYRMETHRVRPWPFATFLQKHATYADWVLDQVRTRGPIAAEDLPAPDGVDRRIDYSWYSVPRATLEAHFGRGLLAVTARRDDFSRLYDLAERVLPSEHHTRRIDAADAQRELVRLAAKAHGIATAADLADYYRMPVTLARARIAELVETGDLVPADVEGRPVFLDKNAPKPQAIESRALLSPFDPVVWYRPRIAWLFDFDYRVEIFFPAAARRWGYYVLPFLLNDRLVARVDLRCDRAARGLLVLAAYLEPHARAAEVSPALATELQTLAAWLKLDTVSVARRGKFAAALASALR